MCGLSWSDETRRCTSTPSLSLSLSPHSPPQPLVPCDPLPRPRPLAIAPLGPSALSAPLPSPSDSKSNLTSSPLSRHSQPQDLRRRPRLDHDRRQAETLSRPLTAPRAAAAGSVNVNQFFPSFSAAHVDHPIFGGKTHPFSTLIFPPLSRVAARALAGGRCLGRCACGPCGLGPGPSPFSAFCLSLHSIIIPFAMCGNLAFFTLFFLFFYLLAVRIHITPQPSQRTARAACTPHFNHPPHLRRLPLL